MALPESPREVPLACEDELIACDIFTTSARNAFDVLVRLFMDGITVVRKIVGLTVPQQPLYTVRQSVDYYRNSVQFLYKRKEWHLFVSHCLSFPLLQYTCNCELRFFLWSRARENGFSFPNTCKIGSIILEEVGRTDENRCQFVRHKRKNNTY